MTKKEWKELKKIAKEYNLNLEQTIDIYLCIKEDVAPAFAEMFIENLKVENGKEN